MVSVESTSKTKANNLSKNIPLERQLLEKTTSSWPRWLIWSAVAICVAPFALSLLGVDFGTAVKEFDPSKLSQLDHEKQMEFFHQALRGGFKHTILEWSAVSVAMFTAFLACMRMVFNRYDSVTPIVGLTFLFTGFMDAFYTLIADQLVTAATDPTNLEPFTWEICRLFHVTITGVGVGAALFCSKKDRQLPLFYVGAASIAISFLACGVMYLSTQMESLPQMMYPDAFLKRPYDTIPLVLYVVAGIMLFRPLYQAAPSCFTFGLLLSLVPQTVTQIHMVFGSAAVYDNHFVMAHFVIILGYFFPLVGLVLDYNYSYASRKQFYKTIAQNNVKLEKEIEAHEKTESDLRFNEARIRGIIDNANDAFVTMDEWGDITSINSAAEKMFEVAQDDVLGEQIKIVIEKFQANEPQKTLSQTDLEQMDFFKSGKEGVGRKKDGTLFPIEVSMSEVECGDQYIFNCIARDITERKRVENEFKKYAMDLELSQRMMEEQGVFLNELSEELVETKNKLHRANARKDDILKER